MLTKKEATHELKAVTHLLFESLQQDDPKLSMALLRGVFQGAFALDTFLSVEVSGKEPFAESALGDFLAWLEPILEDESDEDGVCYDLPSYTEDGFMLTLAQAAERIALERGPWGPGALIDNDTVGDDVE